LLQTARNLTLQIGPRVLVDDASFGIDEGERVALIGRNGSGKSTLLRVLAEGMQPDAGTVECRQGLRVGFLPQTPPAGLRGGVFDVVARGLGDVADLASRYHDAARRVADGDHGAMARLQRLQAELDARDAWRVTHLVEQVLTELDLPADARFETLSGGVQRRALLARAIVSDPHLLVLDEPTNHLDIATIGWLEGYLRALSCALLFVTHDRRFLDNVATRILELDRGRLTSWPGDFATYERRKAEALEAEERANAAFDRKLAQEEAWIRQGIKARRTRNEGRVRALQAMRRERAGRREREGTANLSLQEAERSGRLVIRTRNLVIRYADRVLVDGLSLDINRGERIGLVGPNGVGKTTLIRTLLGEQSPNAGEVRHGTRLAVAYFDQLRAGLDESASVVDNIAGGRETITVDGRSRHVMSYLADFLFAPQRARTPVHALSGGERSRVLLARLFTEPANVLVLDEPTNDLDIETLEILEARLAAFGGTVLLVSHDRAFLDNTVTSLLVFEDGGRVTEHVGGYADWLARSGAAQPQGGRASRKQRSDDSAPARQRGPRTPDKLSYKDQRELDALPGEIEALEERLGEVQTALGEPALYDADQGDRISELTDEMNALEARLARAYERWETLEARRDALRDEG